MKSLKLTLVALFGFVLGAVLFHTSTVGAQGNASGAVTIRGGKMTVFNEGPKTWTGGYVETKGAQVVGFSCMANGDGAPECYVATR